MAHTPYYPAVRLLCQKCRKQTAHIMIDFSNNPLSALTLFYECQECGEIKKVFDLNTLPELKAPVASEPQPRQTAPQTAPQPAQPVQQTAQQTAPQVEKPAIPIEREPQINR